MMSGFGSNARAFDFDFGFDFDFFSSDEQMMRDRVVVKTRDGQEFPFFVEMAVTPDQQQQGLMHREILPEEEGMLFVFGAVTKRSFWMKDTLIPLDIIFLDQDGKINHIHHMAEPQNTTPITSSRPSKAVLEINGGLANRLGIEKGDMVQHPVFRNELAN